MPSVPSRGVHDVKFTRVNATADGDNAVITAVTGKAIRVLSYVLTATAAGTASFQDTAGTPVVHAQFSLAANGVVSFAGDMEAPAFQTAVGTGVEINTATGQDILGHVAHIEIPAA